MCSRHRLPAQSGREKKAMAAFMNAIHETQGEPRPLEAVGAAFARAFAAWTAPTTNDSSHATLAPLASVFRDLPLEITAKCVMAAMGLRWKPICDKIRKHSYAIQNEQYLMPPLESPVFEPVYWPASFEGLHTCIAVTAWAERYAIDATHNSPMIRAGLLAGIRPRLLRHHLRPREGRAKAEKDVSIIHVYN